MMTHTINAIKLMIFDVDGILTNGDIYYDAMGETLKVFSTLDGLGLKLLQQSGVDVAIITGRESLALHKRLDDLNITLRYTGVNDKAAVFKTLLSEKQLSPKETGCMGDDIVDLPIMLCCGLAISVPNAPEIVKNHANWVTTASGGQGACREACEYIMKHQGTWETIIAPFLEPACP